MPNSWERLKEQIKEAAPDLGIDKIGFTTADPFLELKQILVEHREKGYESGFEERDIDKRVYPELSFAEPQSIISIAIAYPAKMENPPKSEPGDYRGILARAAWGEDYHTILRNRLARLEDFIRERVPDARFLSMVDTGVLSDRAVAERSGIGWAGKNCAIITPEFGSWVYLGEMITSIPFPPDTPVMDSCGDCTICVDACPTGALTGTGELNAQLCISFITQTKNEVPDEFKEKIGNRLYGCDTCQVVCPKNRKLNWTHQEELQPDPEIVKPQLKPLLTMVNKDFKERYGNNAAAWRGKKPLQRNAIIALGNFKDKTAIPLLHELLEGDPRPAIRSTAAWALHKIGGEESQAALETALVRDPEQSVRDEIMRFISNDGEVT